MDDDQHNHTCIARGNRDLFRYNKTKMKKKEGKKKIGSYYVMSQQVCDAESDKKEKIKGFLSSRYFLVCDFEVILGKTKTNK